jgi:hypothetical protein
MLISKGMACTVMQSFLMSLKTNQGASGILLCVGAQPSDATVDALTATTPLASSVTATYNTSGLLYALFNATEFPPRYVLTSFPTVNTVNATQAGTISWGIITGAWGFAVVDVTTTNGGGLIEVDTVNVSVGTPVTITNWSFKLGR